MIQSLTASVNLSATEPDTALTRCFPGTWHLQLRSLNQRFFELNCLVPDFVRDLELPLRKLLQNRLIRGRVELRLQYVPEEAHGNKREPDYAQLRRELRRLHDVQRVAKDFGFELPRPNSLELLRHCREKMSCDREGKYPWEEQLSAKKDWQKELLDFCAQACEKLIEGRGREGRELYRELLRLHQSFIRQCKSARQWEAEVPHYYGRQLRKKYQQFQEVFAAEPRSKKTALSEERFLNELSLFLAKGDVREELIRLNIHAQRFFTVLQRAAETEANGSCAKELDFLLQEMNREANTLGSKSPLVELQQTAVRLKVIIERMKEQARNVL
ncbi:MAG: DUF1732 domain-containing protein [Spirochaetota bacterium]